MMIWRQLTSVMAAMAALVLARSAADQVDLAKLCHDAPGSGLVKLEEICAALRTILRSASDQSWNDLNEADKRFMRFGRDTHLMQDTDSEDAARSALHDMYFGIRNKKANAGQMYYGIRQRRSGNYIRFGRSVPEGHPKLQDYMVSFGEPDKHEVTDIDTRLTRSTNPYSMADDIESQEDAKRFMRFGKKDTPGMYYAIRNKKPHGMYFGIRQKKDDPEQLLNGKRFMRFGRDPDDEEDMDDKRFMRFGRGGEDYDADDKRFMRFGRSGEDIDGDKRFMRFGKRFMRFGRGGEADTGDKRFMRFGKKSADEDVAGEKRYMRFGKREDELEEDEKRGFMRFGKREAELPDKKFMRFGKKDDAPEGDKRFMRFGKKSTDLVSAIEDPKDEENEKRYMRFGKKDGSDDGGKRFMRFGKKDGSDEEMDDKRFMRFGKRESTD